MLLCAVPTTNRAEYPAAAVGSVSATSAADWPVLYTMVLDTSAAVRVSSADPLTSAAVIAGVAMVGDVPNTAAPEPVSSVTADARFALEGVPRKVPTPVPRSAEPIKVPLVGKVTFVAPVDVSVIEYAPLVASVDPSTSVNVAPVAGWVTVTLL